MKKPITGVLFTLIALFSVFLAGSTYAQQESSNVLLLTYDGPVTSVMVEYLKRGIQEADGREAEALIFQLNTPGGELGWRWRRGVTRTASIADHCPPSGAEFFPVARTTGAGLLERSSPRRC